MLYLAFIFHMHQPYYKNLLSEEMQMPWVRLHGVKDYADMVQILKNYPGVHQTFNLVPSLLEQVEDYTNRSTKDKFLELSYKPAKELNQKDREAVLRDFFMINPAKVISTFPRYYELYLKKEEKKEFSVQDYLDLQVWFNLSWIDPYFRQDMPGLRNIVNKGRFFTEEEKHVVLESHLAILEEIIPTYQKFALSGQIELSTSPYYHPILPLLYNTKVVKEINPRAGLPSPAFSYPQDAKAQIERAVKFSEEKLQVRPSGMWPSEEAVSEHIVPFIIEAGIKWIVADEAILFKSLKKKTRDTRLLYQPHLLKREGGELAVIFRDRNLSDLIGFNYGNIKSEQAVADFMGHLKNIHSSFNDRDILVTVAMDGENAWEYFTNDGHDFLELLYKRLSESDFIKTVTVSEYLDRFKPKSEIRRLAAGSWIYASFDKWLGNPHKIRAWECLAKAREELKRIVDNDPALKEERLALAYKQMYICEGSDWFWWYGEDPAGEFDVLFRMHLANFYKIIEKDIPDYLKRPL